MKSKINIILPIALAIILPGLGYSANPELIWVKSIGLFGVWFITSVVLYLIWHLLWYLWDFKSGNNKWKFLAVLVALVGFVFGASFLISSEDLGNFKLQNIGRALLGVILFLAIQYALRTQQNISRLLLEKEQMQTENYKVQLKALRAQIDPHFLFNSLNTLRSMVRHQHANSEKFIMSLSGFYRQTLKHNENTTLPLSEELDVLQSYLFLMKSRNEEAVSVDVDIDPAFHQFHLPTLALQIVVENCFKHNSMTSKRPLHIKICSTKDYYIRVSNNLQPKLGENDSSGFGLELLRKRYDLMNIQKGLIVEKTPDQFSVKLKLI